MRTLPDATHASSPRARRRVRISRRLLLVVALFAAGVPAGLVMAQGAENPVYVDDSPTAADALSQARVRLASDDPSGAVRMLERALTTEGHRLMPTPDDPDLFITVRRRLQEVILSDPTLLARYRELSEPTAAALLGKGQVDVVEQSYFLTTSGYDAALALAERRFESAQFDAAWRTIAPLDAHPDRTGARADDALKLLVRIARYTDAKEPAQLIETWRAELGLKEEPEAGRIVGPDLNRGRSTFDPGPQISLTELVSRPLASRPIPSPIQVDPNQQRRINPRSRARTPPLRYILPTVAGDVVYINDGRTLSAWDRFTLDRLWLYTYAKPDANPTTSLMIAGRNAIEDLSTIAVSGRWAVAPGGIAYRGIRLNDNSLHAVDALTGSLRWTATPADLDPALQAGSIRGPALIDQGTVIVGVSKAVKERRLLSFHMVGLDLYTGALRWSEPLGSAGTLPYGAAAKIADVPLIEGGVVYQIDSLGFLAAVQTVTGRVRWLRRLPLQSIIPTTRRTWEGSSLAAHAGVLYAITPDQRNVLAVDTATGVELARRAATEFRNPLYLLSAGKQLVAVGEERVTALTFDNFTNHEVSPRIIADARTTPIQGRAAVAGNRVLLPTSSGVLIAHAAATEPSQAEPAPLDQAGNLVALESELIVADAASLHTFLLWDMAQQVLTQRMAAHPDDPSPATTFVEIAYRAGKTDRLLGAVDAALKAIERDPLNDHIRTVRSRLFNSLWSIVTAPGRRADTTVILDRTLEGALIDRLGRVAGSPAERVRFLLAQGAHYETRDDAAMAIDSYQQILDNSTLALTRFESGGVTAQADLEATRGLTRVVQRFGPGVYSVYEAQARAALAGLTGSQDPDAYVSIAQRYPVSKTAARAWLSAADHYERQGRLRRALASLEDGLAAADNALIEDRALLGELAGRLISALLDTGRLETAANSLEAIRTQRPTLTLSSHGVTLSTQQLADRLSALLTAAHRLPQIGALPQTLTPQLLHDWRVEEPLLGHGLNASTESIVMRSDDEIALWRVALKGGMAKLWSMPIESGVALIASTWNALILSEPTPDGRVFSKLDRATGKRLWRTKSLNELLPTDQTHDRVRLRAATFLLMDHRTLVVVRSDGRSAAFDLETGKQLWSSDSLLPVITDTAAEADTLLLVGDKTTPNPEVAGIESAPALVAVDLRTGRILKRLDLAIGAPRWVRLTPDALAIVGGDLGVLAYDILRDRQVWRANDLAGVRTIDAWALPNRVLILDADAGLWQISLGQAHPSAVALDTRAKLTRTILLNQPIRWALHNDNVTLTTLDGVLVYNAKGELIGADQRGDDLAVLPAAIGLEHSATVSTSPAFIEAGAKWSDLFLFNLPSGALAQRRLIELDAAPENVSLLDGRILVTAGKATLVLDAPVK